MSTAKKVLVIGAGASGLPAIKTALEYGFIVVCYEKAQDIGGLWRFKPDPEPDEGTVMRSTVINTSKEMTAYSDFPPPDCAANYMHNREMLDYLRKYAEKFDLAKHIKFQRKVLNIERTKDFFETGRWDVTYKDISSGEILHEIFDGVMVCQGHHSVPHWPAFAGQSLFKGKIMHSHSYNCANGFDDQTVVVVGIGNSGGDIAVELSKVAKKVYLSTRSGSWVMNRVWDKGEPSDLLLLNRFTFAVRSLAPRSLQNSILERKLNQRFDHGRFGLRPEHRVLQAHLTVNDELPNRIISGTVVVKPNILKFSETGVIFDDGTTVQNVDTVIFATGYSFNFDNIENGRFIEVKDNQVLLYKFMFPVGKFDENVHKNSLAIIGLIQPTGSIMPISEMQCRVFCAQLSGEITLPSQKEMLSDALKHILKNKRQFVDRRRHTLQVYYVTYMDALARLLHAKPNISKYLVTDPKLATRLIFHGLVPYQYRLQGSHKWDGAREAILGVEERVFESTRTRRTPQTEKSKPTNKIFSFKALF
ncbi:flavin-binding monooxygenase-like domain-containing protein [Ditylenchus destructor]|nr:flavin-binding monooxygenase-like domain-containing protein [Ditylenchus destructor]